MQNFDEFLKENYGITEEEFSRETSPYTKHIIWAEWEAYLKQWA